MATFQKFQPFVAALAAKIHDLGVDQLAVALTNTAPSFAAGLLSEISEVDYTFCSARTLTTTASAQTDGIYKLTLADLILTVTGGVLGPFEYVVLYNDSPAGKDLIGYYDYGTPISLLDGETFTIDFDDAAGVLTLE